jgi:hypothetical protein
VIRPANPWQIDKHSIGQIEIMGRQNAKIERIFTPELIAGGAAPVCRIPSANTGASAPGYQFVAYRFNAARVEIESYFKFSFTHASTS